MRSILLFLMCIALTSAATVYVDSATGSDLLGTGTAAAPYKTIVVGIANADFTDGPAYVAVKRVADANLGYDFSVRSASVTLNEGMEDGTFTGAALTAADVGKLMFDNYEARRITAVGAGTFAVESAFTYASGALSVQIHNQYNSLTIANANTSVILGKRLMVVGYHTSFDEATGVSDMDIGQPHYQSPYDALANGVDTTRAVELIANPTRASDFVAVQTDFVQLRNFYIRGTGATYDLLNMSSQYTQYAEFYGVKFGATGASIVKDWFATTPRRGVVFYNCLFDPQQTDITGVTIGGGGCVTFDKCVFNGQDHSTTGYTFSVMIGVGSQAALFDCYFYNGDCGIYPATGAHAFVKNCTFWDQKKYCAAAAGAIVHVYNSIMAPKAGGYAMGCGSPAGSVVEDYNVFWRTDGNAPTDLFNAAFAAPFDPVWGRNSVIANPHLAFKAGVGPVPTSQRVINLKAGANLPSREPASHRPRYR